jgi:murein DD-endopeptidase
MWRARIANLTRMLALGAALASSACTLQSGSVRVDVRPPAALKHAYVPRHGARASLVGGTTATQAAANAVQMIGTPYRWGGESPGGFDCSGLVYYSFGKAGAVVPRTTTQLLQASTPVSLRHARTGDLLFFSSAGKPSHVGIYLGDGRFVHAPSSGKRVEIASLQGGWYRRNFVRAGRLASR